MVYSIYSNIKQWFICYILYIYLEHDSLVWPDPNPELWSSRIFPSFSSFSSCSNQSDRNWCCIGGNDNRPDIISTFFGDSGIDFTSRSSWFNRRFFFGTIRNGEDSEWRSGELELVSDTIGLFSLSSACVTSGVTSGIGLNN